MTVAAIVFDVNESLSDMAPLRGRFVDVGLAPETLDSWFPGVLRDGFALAAVGEFRPFAQIAAGNLRGILDDGQIAHVLAGFRELDTHPDVPEGMQGLAQAGLRLITLTNGASAMSLAMFERAGFLGLLEHTLSVEDVACWKPLPDAYRHAARTADLPFERMAMVAVHPWDIHGAQRAGMVGVWVNRDSGTYPDYLPAPRISISDLRELPAALDGLD